MIEKTIRLYAYQENDSWNIPLRLVRLLLYLYKSQMLSIKWGSHFSNGVRQRHVLRALTRLRYILMICQRI